jgi:sarcosine oxidase
MAMDNDSRRSGPAVSEFSYRSRVILGKENIRRISLLDYVCELQSEDCREIPGQICGIRVRVRDGNANFHSARLVTLGVFSRQHDKLRNSFLSPGHDSTRLPPLRRDGQVPHDYVMSDHQRYNAIVLGLGAMGSATLCQLALRGWRVLGLDQFSQGHSLGSSHGDSRIIRETYFEHPLYVPLVRRAHELWRELEERSRTALMTINGGLMIGTPDGVVVSGTLRSATEHGLPYEILSPETTRDRFPAFRLADDLVAVLDPRAGYLDPEECNKAHIGVAREAGAEVRFDELVREWIPDGEGVRVTTSAGTYLADRLVIAGGAWNAALLPELQLPLTVERQSVFWLEPEVEAEQYNRAQFPIYAYEYTPGNICYGFPRLARGVKASVMHGGEMAAHPDAIRRTVDEREAQPLRNALRPVLPALAEATVRESGVCIFTNTPDHDFIVDFHPDHPQVLVSSACSGHGFKFASALGEVHADLLTTGRARFDLSPFRIDRWR